MKLYMHRFCKVVTSGRTRRIRYAELYMHRFCKVVTSVYKSIGRRSQLYMHRFCKVVTSVVLCDFLFGMVYLFVLKRV